jgi:hypothetical protein
MKPSEYLATNNDAKNAAKSAGTMYMYQYWGIAVIKSIEMKITKTKGAAIRVNKIVAIKACKK